MTDEEKFKINNLCQTVYNTISVNYNINKPISRNIIFRDFNLNSLNQKQVFEYLKKKGINVVKSEKGTELENSFFNKKVNLHSDIISNETTYYHPLKPSHSTFSEEGRTTVIKKIVKRPAKINDCLIGQVQEKVVAIEEMVDIEF